MSTLTPADVERIRARYPQPGQGRRLGRLLGMTLSVVLVAWMIWAGVHGSTPPVTADIHGFRVVDDNHVQADLRVQRRDPSRAALCTLQATAENFVPVGELDAPVPPGTDKITRVTATVKTVNKATTVTVKSCRNA